MLKFSSYACDGSVQHSTSFKSAQQNHQLYSLNLAINFLYSLNEIIKYFKICMCLYYVFSDRQMFIVSGDHNGYKGNMNHLW